MAKVLGLGGVFFKSKDPAVLGAWYQRWLGIDIDPSYGGASFPVDALPKGSYAVWSPFQKDSSYFDPSANPYMINFVVDDVMEALSQVEQGGATLVGTPEDSQFGHFGWFTDPEGNKVELWQPK